MRRFKTTCKTKSGDYSLSLLHFSITTPPTVLEMTGKTNAEFREFHFLKEFNYVEGVRFTARIAEYVPNRNKNTESSIPVVRKGVYTEPGSSFAGERKG